MQYRKMHATGDELSVLGFGCMRMPEIKGKIDEERATAQIRGAIDRGVNYIDTAFPYHMGASEPFLGRALGNGYREKVKVATKLPPWSVKKYSDMDAILNTQLQRLKTDFIDYYLVHSLTKKTWEKMKDLDVYTFLRSAQQEGKIRHIGFSFHGDKDTFKEIVDDFPWDFCQIQYNYLDEDHQAGKAGLEYAASKGLGIIVMEPLRGGKLSENIPEKVQNIFNRSKTERSAAEWALRWIWDHKDIHVVLSGMNQEDHIEENIQIASDAYVGSLSKDDHEIIKEAEGAFRSLMKAGCTGCQYCMPCPAGVDIPLCFEIYNNAYMKGNFSKSKMNYLIRLGGVTTGKKYLASQCTECGSCEKACPQDLPVQKLLKDVAEDFEGRGFAFKLLFVKKFLTFQKWLTLGKNR